MKKLLSIAIFCSLLCTGSNSIAQVGIGTTAPDANAQLDISSTNKGLLIPRMTEAARVGMGTTATNGLLVYQTDVSTGFYFRQNNAWVKLPNTSASTIIPYASGEPIFIRSKSASFPGIPAFVGFGSSVSGMSTTNPIDANLDLTGATGTLLNYAFSMPRAGIIESISGYFSTTSATSISPSTTVSVTAQLYSSTAPDNIFTPIPGAIVNLAPAMSSEVAIGSVSHGITTGLSIAVAAETRLLMVYRVVASGPFANDLLSYLEGYAGGGISITGQ